MRCIVRVCMRMRWALLQGTERRNVTGMDRCLGAPMARMEIACATQDS